MKNSKTDITKDNLNIRLKGIPSAPGMVFGNAYIIYPESVFVSSKKISIDKIEGEIEKLENAFDDTIYEIRQIIDNAKGESKSILAVLETNIYILSDPGLKISIQNRIKQGSSVEKGVIDEFDKQKNFFKKSKDAIMHDRAIEFDHLKESLLLSLRNKCIVHTIPPDSIIIAQSLTPADIMKFRDSQIKGIVTEVGGISSHTSILARSFELPAVIAVKDATSLIPKRSTIILNGYEGNITVNPTEEVITQYRSRKDKEKEFKANLGDLIKLEAKTRDGKEIKLLSNIDFASDVETAVRVGADGIGLVRSENLILNLGRFPTKEEQFKWYKKLAERAYPNDVTIRAFDLGSDKYAENILKHEANPALGFRGIRFLLQNEEVFKDQICAILRTSKNKNVKIMLPMITHVREVIKSIELIDSCKEELQKEQLPFDKNIPVGIMIETPAAALIADHLAHYVNFFSIGTNDLTQYALAADRTNELLSEYFNSFHAAIPKMIKMSVDGASKSGITVSVCGELAGHTGAISLLIGLGVDELSVSPTVLLEIKHQIRNINYSDAVVHSNNILNAGSYDEIRQILSDYNSHLNI